MMTPIVLSAFTAFASVSHAALEYAPHCNALWYESSIQDGPLFAWDVCIIAGTYSLMYTCGDDNGGYLTTYNTSNCTGTGVTESVNGTTFEGYDGELPVCNEAYDCSYTNYTGYKASDGQTCSN